MHSIGVGWPKVGSIRQVAMLSCVSCIERELPELHCLALIVKVALGRLEYESCI